MKCSLMTKQLIARQQSQLTSSERIGQSNRQSLANEERVIEVNFFASEAHDATPCKMRVEKAFQMVLKVKDKK